MSTGWNGPKRVGFNIECSKSMEKWVSCSGVDEPT